MAAITKNHADDLARSGITKDQALAAGIESKTPSEIGGAVSGDGFTIKGDGYMIPYACGLRRYRVFGVTDKDGKEIRYLSPAGEVRSTGLYVPHNFDYSSDTVIITEGEKKALKGCLEGLPVVALPGVDMWADPEQPAEADRRSTPDRPILPDLARITKGRHVVILGDSDCYDYDSDGDYKPGKFKSEHLRKPGRSMLRMAKAISHQVNCLSVTLDFCPPGNGGKQGLDDWLVSEGPEPLESRLESAGYLLDFVKPGWRLLVPYDRNQAGEPLHYKIPFHVPGDCRAPTIFVEKTEVTNDGREEVKTHPTKAPYLWLNRVLLTLKRGNDGSYRSNDGTAPPDVDTEFRGVNECGTEITPIVTTTDLEEIKNLRKLGFDGDVKEGRKLWRAQRGRVPVAMLIDGSGWLNVDGEQHYIYGKTGRVPFPDNKLDVMPIESISRGNETQSAGDPKRQRAALRAAIESQPALACILGFAASGAGLHFVPGAEPGVLHLHGGSGTGKTTFSRFTAALAGRGSEPRDKDSWLYQWRTTDNGLEHPLARRHDAFAVFDEISQAPRSMDWSNTAYMIANGRGRQRMSPSITAREPITWTTQVLSTGEESLMGKITERARNVPQGIEFRIIDLELTKDTQLFNADALSAEAWGVALGEDFTGLHGNALAAAVVEAFGNIAQTDYGHIWPCIIRRLHADRGAEFTAQYKEERARAIESAPENANSPRRRRSKHCASMIAGLRMICRELGLSDDAEAVHVSAARTFALEKIAGAGMESETDDQQKSLHEQLEAAMESHPARFPDPTDQGPDSKPSPVQTWGWINEGRRYLTTEVGLVALCHEIGCDPRNAKSALQAAGWEKSRKRQPGTGSNPRSVFVSPVMEASPEDEASYFNPGEV